MKPSAQGEGMGEDWSQSIGEEGAGESFGRPRRQPGEDDPLFRTCPRHIGRYVRSNMVQLLYIFLNVTTIPPVSPSPVS